MNNVSIFPTYITSRLHSTKTPIHLYRATFSLLLLSSNKFRGLNTQISIKILCHFFVSFKIDIFNNYATQRTYRHIHFVKTSHCGVMWLKATSQSKTGLTTTNKARHIAQCFNRMTQDEIFDTTFTKIQRVIEIQLEGCFFYIYI